MAEYKLLTREEAKEYPRLWRLFKEEIGDNELLVHLISIAVDTCNYCGSSDGSCQCWNDE